MKIQLRGIRYSAKRSGDTPHFRATLVIDGKPIGNVSNDGRGGFNRFAGDQVAYAKAVAWVKENLPPEVVLNHVIPPSLDNFVTNLVEDYVMGQDMDRMFKTHLLFSVNDEIMVVPHKGEYLRPMIIECRRRYPGAAILNLMPRADALAIYKRHLTRESSRQAFQMVQEGVNEATQHITPDTSRTTH